MPGRSPAGVAADRGHMDVAIERGTEAPRRRGGVVAQEGGVAACEDRCKLECERRECGERIDRVVATMQTTASDRMLDRRPAQPHRGQLRTRDQRTLPRRDLPNLPLRPPSHLHIPQLDPPRQPPSGKTRAPRGFAPKPPRHPIETVEMQAEKTSRPPESHPKTPQTLDRHSFIEKLFQPRNPLKQIRDEPHAGPAAIARLPPLPSGA
jgi:hypothetical protein